jgi:hypothetical protein
VTSTDGGTTGAGGGTTGGGAAASEGASPGQPSATLQALQTPGDPATRAVLTAIDSMNSHGAYRITLDTDGAKAFLEVLPPSRSHYYVTKGSTVGEEISVDGAVWTRGPDGRWHSTDEVTHHGPLLTVADVTTVNEEPAGSGGSAGYRTFRVDGKDATGTYRATVTVRTADGRLRDVRTTGSDQVTTTYTFDYPPTLTITPPATSP